MVNYFLFKSIFAWCGKSDITLLKSITRVNRHNLPILRYLYFFGGCLRNSKVWEPFLGDVTLGVKIL